MKSGEDQIHRCIKPQSARGSVLREGPHDLIPMTDTIIDGGFRIHLG